jgi:peptide/nickel transport system substrate-binding protein
VIDQQSYAPYEMMFEVTWDLALNYESASIWPYNLRFKDKEGGVMKIGTNDLFSAAVESCGGSNSVWDVGVMRATTQGTSGTVGGAA